MCIASARLRREYLKAETLPEIKRSNGTGKPSEKGEYSQSKSVCTSQQVQDIKSKNNRTKRKTHKPTIIREILTRLSVK